MVCKSRERDPLVASKNEIGVEQIRTRTAGADVADDAFRVIVLLASRFSIADEKCESPE